MKSNHLRKAKRSSSLDKISTLPQLILETILSCLPTKEAARTSILSREWRYKWTKVPKLEFYISDVSEETTVQGITCTLFDAIHQILLLHKAPIHEFTLYIDTSDVCTDRDRDDYSRLEQIILHLSKNHTIKKFKLTGMDFTYSYNLPVSVFSLHHLTHLYLSCVDLGDQRIFVGFSNLESLVLHEVEICTETLLHLLSNSPSLKSLALLTGDYNIGNCTIVELFECLLMIERLTICYDVFKWLDLNDVPKELPTSLVNLKYFSFKRMSFDDGYGLPFLLDLLKCSPNLEKLKIHIVWGISFWREYSVVWEEYSDVWLERLTEFEVRDFRNEKLEMELVKFVLARSPNLKKVNIIGIVNPSQESKVLRILLQAPRASPVTITYKHVYETAHESFLQDI